MKKSFKDPFMGVEDSLPVIAFNREEQAVVIWNGHSHFLLSPMPSMKGSFGTAQWAVERNQGWKLPSEEEVTLINDYLDEINELLLANNYPPIDDEERWWIDEYHIAESLIDTSWARCFPLGWRHTSKRKIDEACEFRLVKPMSPCVKV